MFVLHNKIGCLCVCILCYFIFFPSFCFIYSNPNWTARKHPHSNPCMLLFWNMPIARFYANIVTALFFHCSILILHLNWFCAHFHVQKCRWLLFLKIRGIFGFTATAWWYTTWFLFLLSRSMCDKVFTRLGSCLFWICIYIILFSFLFCLPYLWIFTVMHQTICARWVRLVTTLMCSISRVATFVFLIHASHLWVPDIRACFRFFYCDGT